MSLFVAGAGFGDLGVSLFVAGAVFGDLGVSLFAAGAAFGDLGVSLFVTGAVFGDLGASLFVPGAIDSRSAKRCNFQYKMRLRSAKSNLLERAGARCPSVFGSCSDHGRITVRSWSNHARIKVESVAHCK